MGWTKAYRLAANEVVLDYLLDHPCVDCNEDDPVVLDFDHRDPEMKRMGVSELVRRVTGNDLFALKTEMDKCDVRCSNCHRKKTAKERNYTRYRLCVEQHLIDY